MKHKFLFNGQESILPPDPQLSTEKIDFPSQNQIDTLRRRFFVGPGDDEIFRKWGHQAMELALQWLKNPENNKIHADISLPELAEMFNETDFPTRGSEIEEVFEECQRTILDNSVRVNNPRYIGHMTSAVPWFSAVVDILITSINQNQVKIETALASSFVEKQTIAWIHKLVYGFEEEFYERHIQNHSVALGNMASGGTIGNLTALAIARERCFPGILNKGWMKALKNSPYTDVAILASKRVHYSITKSAGVLGLGTESVVTIPVDDYNRISIPHLQAKIKELQEQDVCILALVGIGGTTETGNIDPLDEMAEIAEAADIWFHVDAAWGGALLLSPQLKHRLKGIERADSVVIDGHKLFCLPLAHGMVMFKNQQTLNELRHNAQYIIRKGSVDLGQTSLEGSRRFNALKLWFSLKILGREGYNVLLHKSMQLTELMKNLIDADSDFERTSEPQACIMTYRYVPAKVMEMILHLREEGRTQDLYLLNKQLNTLNVELQKRQRNNGQSFVSRTMLESTGYEQNIVVFRIVLTNLLTKSVYLQEILDEQREIGQGVLREKPLIPVHEIGTT